MTSPLRILFVDDQPVAAYAAIEPYLRDFWVSLVFSVADATHFLSREAFGLVLVDYDLEDGKGTAVIEAARRSQPGALVIAVSDHELGNRALLRAGADAVCRKDDLGGLRELVTALQAPGQRAEQG